MVLISAHLKAGVILVGTVYLYFSESCKYLFCNAAAATTTTTTTKGGTKQKQGFFRFYFFTFGKCS